MDHLRKKLRGHCPCGYAFVILGEEDKAISLIQAHFDLFHKDLLPFGITHYEASTLVQREFAYKKPKALKGTLDLSQTKADSMLKKRSASVRRKESDIFSTA